MEHIVKLEVETKSSEAAEQQRLSLEFLIRAYLSSQPGIKTIKNVSISTIAEANMCASGKGEMK